MEPNFVQLWQFGNGSGFTDDYCINCTVGVGAFNAIESQIDVMNTVPDFVPGLVGAAYHKHIYDFDRHGNELG